MVDKQLAEHTFPGENPLGRRIRLRMPIFPGGPPAAIDAEIIGVAADVRDDGGLEAPSRRTVYLPHRVISLGGGAFAVRTSIDPDEVFPRIREQIAELDAAVPLFAVRPMQGYIDDALAPVRFMLILIGLFGAFALVLAAIGLVIAIPLTRATQSLFVGVAPSDPLTLVGISALLLGVSVLACYVPARRASRLDPATSLRSD